MRALTSFDTCAGAKPDATRYEHTSLPPPQAACAADAYHLYTDDTQAHTPPTTPTHTKTHPHTQPHLLTFPRLPLFPRDEAVIRHWRQPTLLAQQGALFFDVGVDVVILILPQNSLCLGEVVGTLRVVVSFLRASTPGISCNCLSPARAHTRALRRSSVPFPSLVLLILPVRLRTLARALTLPQPPYCPIKLPPQIETLAS